MTVTSLPGTAQQHAVDALRQMIVSGALRPGARANQEIIAETIGLSIAPVREALRVLEQEGQVTYKPRRGYFITALLRTDLEEIYAMRQLLEERAARHALPHLDDEALGRVRDAAAACVLAADGGDVAGELAANRRFHLGILEPCGQSHLLRVIHMLWNSTEAYRALYYNLPDERNASLDAHERILVALARRDADEVVRELDDHRQRALHVLAAVLEPVPVSS